MASRLCSDGSRPAHPDRRHRNQRLLQRPGGLKRSREPGGRGFGPRPRRPPQNVTPRHAKPLQVESPRLTLVWINV